MPSPRRRGGGKRRRAHQAKVGRLRAAIADGADDVTTHASLAFELGKLAAVSPNDGRTATKLRREAIKHYDKAIEMGAESFDVLHNCARLYERLADTTRQSPVEERGLRLRAIELHSRGIGIAPHSHQSYHNWGIQLGCLAGLVAGDVEQERLLRREAVTKYKKSIELEPGEYRSRLNLGAEMSLIAELQRHEPAEAKTIRRQAIDQLRQALDIGGERFDTLYNLGVQLGRLADASRTESDVADLRAEAVEHLQVAVDHEPDHISAVFRLGYEQYELSYALDPDDPRRLRLLSDAVGHLRRSAEARPTAQYIKTHLADSLLRLGPLLGNNPDRQRKVWDVAEQVMVQCAVAAGRVLPQMFPYASMLAQQGSPRALESLRACLEAGTVQPHSVRRDPDWQEYVGDPEFEALLGGEAPDDEIAPSDVATDLDDDASFDDASADDGSQPVMPPPVPEPTYPPEVDEAHEPDAEAPEPPPDMDALQPSDMEVTPPPDVDASSEDIDTAAMPGLDLDATVPPDLDVKLEADMVAAEVARSLLEVDTYDLSEADVVEPESEVAPLVAPFSAGGYEALAAAAYGEVTDGADDSEDELYEGVTGGEDYVASPADPTLEPDVIASMPALEPVQADLLSADRLDTLDPAHVQALESQPVIGADRFDTVDPAEVRTMALPPLMPPDAPTPAPRKLASRVTAEEPEEADSRAPMRIPSDVLEEEVKTLDPAFVLALDDEPDLGVTIDEGIGIDEESFAELVDPSMVEAAVPSAPLPPKEATHSLDGEPGLIVVEQTDSGAE